MTLDPRLSNADRDPRMGRPLLKAVNRRVSRVAPEAERPFWGPHPDRLIASIEDEFYQAGFHFLSAFLGAALGKKAPGAKVLTKAFNLPSPHVHGWGKVADLFRTDIPPVRLLQGWEATIDQVLKGLWPDAAKQQSAEYLALRTHWMTQAGERVASTPPFSSWGHAIREMSRAQVESMEWTKARALVYASKLQDDARNAMRALLVNSKQAGEGPAMLERRLFEKFGNLNRDWRRIALTETAFATQNGALASVDPAEGWLAVWSASPRACPYCRKMHGTALRVVSPDKANKDPENEVWIGKSNVGLSASKWSKKEGRYRDEHELWKPCIPAHPNCGCVFTLRKKPQPAK